MVKILFITLLFILTTSCSKKDTAMPKNADIEITNPQSTGDNGENIEDAINSTEEDSTEDENSEEQEQENDTLLTQTDTSSTSATDLDIGDAGLDIEKAIKKQK